MLYHLLYPLHSRYSIFNVFRYITFRAAYATLTALVLSFVLGPRLIEWLRQLRVRETIRELGPKAHQAKAGTPTMGGILILFSLIVPTLLWSDLTNQYVWVVLLVTVSFGLIGFSDDYLKLRKKKGLSVRTKFSLQIMVATVISLYLYYFPAHSYTTELTVPFLKNFQPNLHLFYIPFAIAIIVGTSNGVNLTDGLDGLAIGPMIISAMTFMVICYVVGHSTFASYLMIINVKGAGELAVFCGTMVGAGLGFLWFNAYPAQVFMGDTGSLPLGAALGTVAIIAKHELLLVIVGGLFVIETVSVIIQVSSFRLRGRRVFQMAPIHHHFELKGWAEPKVIVRFWIISIILALVSLSTLKLR
jgi:phospho-N-acetylmuramoyl-pentapeptide-transferase